MISQLAQLLGPELSELEIQPVDERGHPATLAEIARRIRVMRYRCEECGGLLGARVEARPVPKGVRVHPLPGEYRIVVGCMWCSHEEGLSDIIRARRI